MFNHTGERRAQIRFGKLKLFLTPEEPARDADPQKAGEQTFNSITGDSAVLNNIPTIEKVTGGREEDWKITCELPDYAAAEIQGQGLTTVPYRNPLKKSWPVADPAAPSSF